MEHEEARRRSERAMGRSKGAEVQLFVLGGAQYKFHRNIATSHPSLITSATPQG